MATLPYTVFTRGPHVGLGRRLGCGRSRKFVLPSNDVNGDETMRPFAGKRADCRVPRYDPDPIPDIKAQLRQAVVDALVGWSQVNAAWWIGSDQGRVSDLRRNKLERFSVEQLIRFLSRVDRRVEIVIHDDRRRIRRRIVPSV
jgi:predicted XRE-type DNA-binding protein